MGRHTWKTSSSWTQRQSGSSKLRRDKPAEEDTVMVLCGSCWLWLIPPHFPGGRKCRHFCLCSVLKPKTQTVSFSPKRTSVVFEKNSFIPTVTGSTVVEIHFSQSVAALEPQYCNYWCNIGSIICVLWFITTNLFQSVDNTIQNSPTII